MTTLPEEAVTAATAIIRAHDNEAWGEDCGDEPYADLVTRMLTAALPFLSVQGALNIDAIVQPLEDIHAPGGLCRWTDVATAIGEVRRSLSALEPTSDACQCTKIQQDETCPVGYPSLLCEICDGKGVLQSSAARELHGPFGHIVGRRDLREDEWSLENDPVNEDDAANGFFSVPLYALTDPFKEIGIEARSNAASLTARELALEEAARIADARKPLYTELQAKNAGAEIASSIRALSSPVPGKVEGNGSRWRIFKAACTRGYWGIELEQASNDDEPILYPIKVHRDTLVRIVEAHNAGLPSAPASEGAE